MVENSPLRACRCTRHLVFELLTDSSIYPKGACVTVCPATDFFSGETIIASTPGGILARTARHIKDRICFEAPGTPPLIYPSHLVKVVGIISRSLN